jgi:hypothetical protein
MHCVETMSAVILPDLRAAGVPAELCPAIIKFYETLKKKFYKNTSKRHPNRGRKIFHSDFLKRVKVLEIGHFDDLVKLQEITDVYLHKQLEKGIDVIVPVRRPFAEAIFAEELLRKSGEVRGAKCLYTGTRVFISQSQDKTHDKTQEPDPKAKFPFLCTDPPIMGPSLVSGKILGTVFLEQCMQITTSESYNSNTHVHLDANLAAITRIDLASLEEVKHTRPVNIFLLVPISFTVCTGTQTWARHPRVDAQGPVQDHQHSHHEEISQSTKGGRDHLHHREPQSACSPRNNPNIPTALGEKSNPQSKGKRTVLQQNLY